MKWGTDWLAESLAHDKRLRIEEDNPATGRKRYYLVINGKNLPLVGLQAAFERQSLQRSQRSWGPNEWRSFHESRRFGPRLKRAWAEARAQARFQNPVAVFFRHLFS